MATLPILDPLYVRPMVEADLERVLETERSAYEFPWWAQIFLDCLRAEYHCFVGVHEGMIVAHAVLSSVLDEAHLLNICVARDVQRQGFGQQLLEAMQAEAVARGAQHLFLEVRPSNIVALRLYRERGFEIIGRRRNYYPAGDQREDALVLRLGLD